MATLLVPVLYLFVVFGGLYVFSYYYRRSVAAQTVELYFGPHHERNVYVSLIQMDPQPPESVLKAALMRRAMTDVYRLIRIREDKPALQALLQKGSVGDDVQASLDAAERELSAEILEVVHEANSFVPNWGQFIFPSASEIVANERTRAIFEKIPNVKADLEVRYGVKAKPSIPVNVTLQRGPPPRPTPSTSSTPPPHTSLHPNGPVQAISGTPTGGVQVPLPAENSPNPSAPVTA